MTAAIYILKTYNFNEDRMAIYVPETDIVDIWSGLSNEQRKEKCAKEKILRSEADFELVGFSKEDCVLEKTEVVENEPTLGNDLRCIYICEK